MHPDLPKLLDVQGKDRHLSQVTARREQLAAERASLDAALDTARQQIVQAERMASETAARRDERGAKLESQKGLQDKRRARLDQERSPRIAAQLMADVDMARGILAQEEAEWLRLAEDATAREAAVGAARERLSALETEQVEVREGLTALLTESEAEYATASTERNASAAELGRALRTRYDRIHGSRRSAVLVPAVNATCTGCYTAIPRSRIGQLQADGLLLEGCEMCGAILYLEEVPA